MPKHDTHKSLFKAAKSWCAVFLLVGLWGGMCAQVKLLSQQNLWPTLWTVALCFVSLSSLIVTHFYCRFHVCLTVMIFSFQIPVNLYSLIWLLTSKYFSPKTSSYIAGKYWQQDISVSSKWQRQTKVMKMTPDYKRNNTIKSRPNKCTYKILGNKNNFLLWWGLINLVGLGYLFNVHDLRMEASALFFCVFLLLEANMRKITGSRFSDSWNDGLIRCFLLALQLFGDGGCFESQATSRVRWWWGGRTPWTRSKPELIRGADKTMRASLRASTNYTAK